MKDPRIEEIVTQIREAVNEAARLLTRDGHVFSQEGKTPLGVWKVTPDTDRGQLGLRVTCPSSVYNEVARIIRRRHVIRRRGSWFWKDIWVRGY